LGYGVRGEAMKNGAFKKNMSERIIGKYSPPLAKGIGRPSLLAEHQLEEIMDFRFSASN
jgi:hypothetical protein